MNNTLSICVENLDVNFDDRFQLSGVNWTLESGQHWLITGANGSGKSALAAVLSGFGENTGGTICGLPTRVGVVSFEAQAELIDAELKKDDADILDVISEGTPVYEIIANGCLDKALAEQLIVKFGLQELMDRSFRKLSTGETRKVLLIKALSCKPELLVLDEPFEGLDAQTHKMLQLYLAELAASIPMVIVLNRFDEKPAFITDIAYVENGELLHKVSAGDEKAYAELYQLLHLKTSKISVPDSDPATAIAQLDSAQPLVRLTDISIKYGDITIVEGLNWTIEPHQHWQLSGPNGSGKTGVLSLITGDHPQCYVNDIFVFGYKRGSGESIWQIKQFIGYVSTALQWEYRVSTSVRNVVISGFYDSIGLYSKSTDRQKTIANQWLALLGIQDRADQPFNKLSYGDQRLLLIARAMVKHPPLLILDEPCLGLDDMNRQLVLALIEKICASGRSTVLYVNHHAEDKIQGIDNYLALHANDINSRLPEERSDANNLQ